MRHLVPRSALHALLLVLASTVGRPARLVGQYGRAGSGSFALGMEISYSTSSIDTSSVGRERLDYAVLWRMPVGSSNCGTRADTALATSARRQFRALLRAAEDSGRSFSGTVSDGLIRGYMVSHPRISDLSFDSAIPYKDTIWIAGASFVPPDRDSALVILVDLSRAPAQEGRVVGHAYVPDALPDEASDKHWTHGDTTFTVHPRNPERSLREVVIRSPMVRAFVEQSEAIAAPVEEKRAKRSKCEEHSP